MQKKDLKNGMEVGLRNGDTYLVDGTRIVTAPGICSGGVMSYNLTHFHDDLTCKTFTDRDIVNVTQPETILWIRKDGEPIMIDGKEYSESTIHNALKAYVGVA